MLRHAISGRPVTELPRNAQDELEAVLTRLEPQHVAAMEQQINGWADSTGDENTDFFASNWQKGISNWEDFADGTFQPLYEACVGYHEDPVQYAGWMYGLLVRRAMSGRTAEWNMYKNHEAGAEEL